MYTRCILIPTGGPTETQNVTEPHMLCTNICNLRLHIYYPHCTQQQLSNKWFVR